MAWLLQLREEREIAWLRLERYFLIKVMWRDEDIMEFVDSLNEL